MVNAVGNSLSPTKIESIQMVTGDKPSPVTSNALYEEDIIGYLIIIARE